jgi:deazaflavin-dependent oxidoreductase (nitroreductase family)
VADDWNAKIIEEFRTHEGRVGGPFEGAPLVLVHHTGRKSGTERVSPMMYQAGPGDTIYVFCSKAGAPDNPDWYYNLVAGTPASVEIGTQSWPVTVEEVTGEARDTVYRRQAAAYPGFAEYEEKTRGIRTIPVLALTRSRT